MLIDRLKGGYNEINGGRTCNALVDLTGGISETVDLHRHHDVLKLWDILLVMKDKMSLMAAAKLVFTTTTKRTQF